MVFHLVGIRPHPALTSTYSLGDVDTELVRPFVEDRLSPFSRLLDCITVFSVESLFVSGFYFQL